MAASTLLSLVTVPCSVAAAASTILYRQLYSAEDNDHEEEQLYSADDKDNNDGDDDDDDGDDYNNYNNVEDYVGIHTPADDKDDDEDDNENNMTTTMMTATKSTTSIFTSILTMTTTIFSIWTLTLRKNSSPAFQRT